MILRVYSIKAPIDFNEVLNRFKNTWLNHQLIRISLSGQFDSTNKENILTLKKILSHLNLDKNLLINNYGISFEILIKSELNLETEPGYKVYIVQAFREVLNDSQCYS